MFLDILSNSVCQNEFHLIPSLILLKQNTLTPQQFLSHTTREAWAKEVFSF